MKIVDAAAIIISISAYSDTLSNHPTKLIWLISLFTLTFITLFWILSKSDIIVRKIAGPKSADVPEVNSIWIFTSLRAVLCFCGFMILLHGGAKGLLNGFGRAFVAVDKIVDMIIYRRTFEIIEEHHVFLLRELLGFAKGIIGIYLICGAPCLTQWWIRKQVPEQEKPAPSYELNNRI